MFDKCSNQPCCNDELYQPQPSCLTSHDNKLYRIELVSQFPDQTIQSLLDESHNNFTDHADVSCEEMGHPCCGRRRTKVTVTRAPVLLEVYIAVFREGQTVLNPSQFETRIVLHDVTYVLVGAILHDGSHFRSINIYKGNFLMYDGIRNEEDLNYMRWIGGNESFGKNWKAKSFWYCQEDISKFSFFLIISQQLCNSRVILPVFFS